jgi:hypothetical protein
MISKQTLAYLKEFERLGTLKSYTHCLRFQLKSEEYLFGIQQIATQEELKSAQAILDGTFDETRDLIPAQEQETSKLECQSMSRYNLRSKVGNVVLKSLRIS